MKKIKLPLTVFFLAFLSLTLNAQQLEAQFENAYDTLVTTVAISTDSIIDTLSMYFKAPMSGQNRTISMDLLDDSRPVILEEMRADSIYVFSSMCDSSGLDFSNFFSIYHVSADQQPLVFNKDSISSSTIFFTPPTPGDYKIRMREDSANQLSNCSIIISINQPNPSVIPLPTFTLTPIFPLPTPTVTPYPPITIAPRAVVKIPVVYHIVDAFGRNFNHSAVLNSLDSLNIDFRKMNADTSKIPAAFLKLADDSKIEFCWAQQKPNGDPTDGVEYLKDGKRPFYNNQSGSDIGDDTPEIDSLKKATSWDPEHYLNIWVVKTNQATGTYPGMYLGKPTAYKDGVVIPWECMSGQNRLLTHEVGHYFDLIHIWGAKKDCSDDDECADTPLQEGPTLPTHSPVYPETDACTKDAPGIMFMNFMDYWKFRRIFSKDQVTRMRTALYFPRKKLLESKGCEMPKAKGKEERVAMQNQNAFELPDAISVYPNPSKGAFSVSVNEMFDKMNLSVTNILGEKVFETTTSEKETNINLGNQLSGVYFLRINSDAGTTTKKIILNK